MPDDNASNRARGTTHLFIAGWRDISADTETQISKADAEQTGRLVATASEIYAEHATPAQDQVRTEDVV